MKLGCFILICVSFLITLNDNKYKVPKELVQFENKLWIDKYEINIRDYYYFLMNSDDKEMFEEHFPNPNYIGWSDGYWQFNNIYIINDSSVLFQVPHWWRPIVNIDKEDAVDYCDWRTKKWNLWYNSLPERKQKRYPENLIFRLPTKEEWIKAASGNLNHEDFPFGVKKEKKINVVSLDYFTHRDIERGILMPEGAASPWEFGHENEIGIFNMCGDVAEFILDSDVVLGGSFRDSIENCKVISNKKYERPKDWIGFRCLGEIHEIN